MSGITAGRVAAFLGLPLHGPDGPVTRPAPAARPEPGALVFAKAFTPEAAAAFNAAAPLFVIGAPEFAGALTVAHVLAPRPRLAFARVLQEFFREPAAPGIHPSAVIDPSAVLEPGVTVGPHCVVGPGVRLGAGTELRAHVTVARGCTIGRGCLIRSASVIGEEGFGFDFAEDGTPVRLLHLAAVRIGDEVEIGALNTVARGTLEDTVLADRVKTDDHVHLSHNVTVGPRTVITACAEVSGSVRIGADVWIGPQAAILNGLTVGDRAVVGIGAVVTRPVEAATVVGGNPARLLRRREPGELGPP